MPRVWIIHFLLKRTEKCPFWDLPQARGIWVALEYSRQLFALPDEELAKWYPEFQREFLLSDS